MLKNKRQAGGKERENNLHFDIHDTVFLYSSTRDKNEILLIVFFLLVSNMKD